MQNQPKDRKMITQCITQNIVKADYVRLECRDCKGALEINKPVDEDIKCPYCKRCFQKEAVAIVNIIFLNKYELNKNMADKVSLVSFKE
ncbi:hypothetical protein [Sulfurimonas sp.]|uniref:hypothetical protein n=1 Tax=Sulfurimonas sp. TaxID=2022749 RepID=UPI002B47BEC1|nr:hypothetical protein [Sulfurimonas sp.]